MENSNYTNPGCGCHNSGLANGTTYTLRNCGCGGLGEATDPANKTAKETKKDLVETAKKYINGEIPIKYKIGAGITLLAILLLTTRRN